MEIPNIFIIRSRNIRARNRGRPRFSAGGFILGETTLQAANDIALNPIGNHEAEDALIRFVRALAARQARI
jgi:hypothetical protein